MGKDTVNPLVLTSHGDWTRGVLLYILERWGGGGCVDVSSAGKGSLQGII